MGSNPLLEDDEIKKVVIEINSKVKTIEVSNFYQKALGELFSTINKIVPEHKEKQLREIAEIIVKAVGPEKVILFGSHAATAGGSTGIPTALWVVLNITCFAIINLKKSSCGMF